LGQLARVEELNRKRAQLAAHYRERFRDIEEIRPLSVPTYSMKHAWHLYVVRLDIDRTGLSRDDFMNELKKRNIGTGIHFRAAHLQKYYVEALNGRRGQLPNTEWNSDRICSLPLFPDMTFTDVDDVVEAIKEVLKRQNRKG
jgi:UDP-4-amino-4-deoxy-L-arabinose-oxoglutarate aminotransferase